MAIKILLVDDHMVLREGLRALLSTENDLHVVGGASNGRDAIEAVDRYHPDVVVTDISMPGMNGIETVRQLRQSHPLLKLIILSMHANQAYVIEALQAGAHGYVVKQADATEVVHAIRAVVAGSAYISPIISKDLTNDYLTRKPSELSLPKLTTREREVAQLIAEGHSTRDISKMLTVSVKTVETHRANIMHKLSTKSATDIVKYALKRGWITLDN